MDRRRPKKRQAAKTACQIKGEDGSDVRLGLTQTLNPVARLPLTTLPQNIDPFEPLEYVALNDEAGGPLETFVL
jgi:hypothetical protein